jgi:hypothetical protein
MKTKAITIESIEYTLLGYKGEWVFPRIATYADGLGSPICMELLQLAGGCLEPYTVVTVNLPGCDRRAGCQFVDTNNNGDDILDWLESNGFGKRTGNYGRSGFCAYPEFNFYAGETFREYKAINDRLEQ